jgi:hypothetical protein
MANNRMWLVCPVVGPNTHLEPSHFMLAKAYSGWYSTCHENAFDEWLDEHTDCGWAQEDRQYTGTVPAHFELKYEDPG